jgi:DNA-binding CsgD family transcriptional regulator
MQRAAGLLEREREAAAIGDALAGVADGGALVVVEGPPGIGKTRLLGRAREQARAADLRVLGARGSELEQGVPFALLRQALDPLAAAGLAERLTGAAALAAPVVDPAGSPSGEAGDVLPALNGLFWLVSDLAREQPLALLLDDLQWADAPSLQFVAFLARRLEDLPVVVVAATRRAVDAGDPLLARIVTDPAARVLRPAPLSEDAIRALAADALAAAPHDAFVASCAQASGGNPFFVGELLREVADRRLEPDRAAAHVVDRLAPEGVAAMVMLRLAGAPPGARELAGAIAVLGADATLADAAAIAGQELEQARAAAAALVQAGLLLDAPRPAFVHPVLRAAIERGIPGPELERAHTLAAERLQARGAAAEDVAAHLVRTAPQGDAATVALLRAAARRAVALGAPASALAPLERALAEPPRAGDRFELLLELGRVAAATGSPDAERHLRGAIDDAPDAAGRARGALELVRAVRYGGGGPDAAPIVERSMAETHDRTTAELLEIELLCTATVSRALRERMQPRIDALAEPPPGARGAFAGCVLATLAFDAGARGPSAGRALALARRVPEALDGAVEPPGDWVLLIAMAAAIWAEAYGEADRLGQLLEAEARRRGTAMPQSAVAGLRSMLNVRRGRLADAEADAAFAIQLAEEVHGTDVFATVARSSAALAAVDRDAGPGELRALLPGLAGGGRADFLPLDSVTYARAHVRLAIGEPDGALQDLRQLERLNAPWEPGPGPLPWRAAAAHALLRLDEPGEAAALAAEEVRRARAFGAPRALGMALHAAALAQPSGRAEALGEAVEVLERADAQLELARVLVDLGAEIRRARRPVDAREPLRRGAELALRCGAHAVVRRARDELLASGARPRRVALQGAEALTPSERRVAELAAAGRTNREIAQELYVTEKTVEGHLSHAYDKLGIRSRSALPDALR